MKRLGYTWLLLLGICWTARLQGQTFVSPGLLSAPETERSLVARLDMLRVQPATALRLRSGDSIASTEVTNVQNRIREAKLFILSHPRRFRLEVQRQKSGDNGGVQDSLAANHVQVAAAIANDDQFESLLRNAPRSSVSGIAREREGLLDALRTTQPRTLQASVFADGAIRGAAEGRGNDPAVSTGSLALAVRSTHQLWFAAITIASTQDTLRNGFGSALLAPGAGGALSSGLVSLHLPQLIRGAGLHGYMSASRFMWEISDTAAPATLLGGGILGYYNVAQGEVANTNIDLAVEGGLMGRVLGGDILSLSDDKRRLEFGSTRRAFGGAEAGATVTVGALVGAVQLYWIHRRGEERIPGLSDFQMVAGLSVKGRLFGGPITSP